MGVDPRPGDIAQARAVAARRRRERTVFGENAAEKARTPVVQKAREVVDEIVQGAPAKSSADRLRALGLSHSERKDVESYSRARSQQATDKSFSKLTHGTARLADDVVGAITGVNPSVAYESYRHPIKRLQHVPTPEETAQSSLIPFGLGRLGRAAKPAVEAVAEAAKPAGAKAIIESLPAAKKLRIEQERGYSVERSKRAARAASAAERAGGGEAGLRAARAELRGELPKLSFDKLVKTYGDADSELRLVFQPQVDEMLDFVRNHPSTKGREFRTQNTQAALLKALNGDVPTRSEIKLLEGVFGEEATKTFKWRRAHDVAVKALNLPRSLMSTFDISFPFRQGLVLGAAHPGVWARSWGPMLKSFGSPRVARAVLDEIDARPTRELMDEAGVKLTKFTSDAGAREEQFISDWGEKIPVIGMGVRASTRAFTVFGNKLRADSFDLLLEQAENSSGGVFASAFRKASPGLDELSPVKRRELLEGIGSIINVGTGRGGMGLASLEKAAPLLAAGLFSPRLIASRIALLNPVYYAKLPPFARKQAAEAMLKLVGSGTLVLFLAKQAGADVSDDPRNADFGKIRVGDTRVDIWGGLQQYVVNGYRIAKKESVASTTGEVKTLNGGFGEQSRFDIGLNFALGKAAPVPAYVIGSAKGKDASGAEFDEVSRGLRSFVPFGIAGGIDAYKAAGVADAAAAVGLGGIGFGVQTYALKPSRGAQKAYKEALKDIAAGVRRGEITRSDASEFKKRAHDALEANLREKQLSGLPEPERNRQLVIDDGVRNDDALEDVNAFLASAGYPPVSQEEFHKTERELLKLDVQVGH